MKELRFSVPGVPAPQGSMRAFMPKGARFPVVTADNPKTKPWRTSVAFAAAQARKDGELMTGPVELSVAFFFPRPKSLPKKVRQHTKKPDLDKLVRAICDALKGVAWVDDSQVVGVRADKYYGVPGCHVCVQEVSA